MTESSPLRDGLRGRAEPRRTGILARPSRFGRARMPVCRPESRGTGTSPAAGVHPAAVSATGH